MGMSMTDKNNRWTLLRTKREIHGQLAFSEFVEDNFYAAQEYLTEDSRLIEGMEIEIKLDADALRHAVVLRGKITVEPG